MGGLQINTSQNSLSSNAEHMSANSMDREQQRESSIPLIRCILLSEVHHVILSSEPHMLATYGGVSLPGTDGYHINHNLIPAYDWLLILRLTG